FFSGRAPSSASLAHGYQSEGLVACCFRYGLVSAARRFVYFGMPSLFECSICIMIPGPALMARSIAALELVHVNDTQVAGTTESGKICDPDDCAAGSDESLVHK